MNQAETLKALEEKLKDPSIKEITWDNIDGEKSSGNYDDVASIAYDKGMNDELSKITFFRVIQKWHEQESKKEGMKMYRPQMGYELLEAGWQEPDDLRYQSPECIAFLASIFLTSEER